VVDNTLKKLSDMKQQSKLCMVEYRWEKKLVRRFLKVQDILDRKVLISILIVFIEASQSTLREHGTFSER
jgi:hypothetical protein